MEYTVKKLSELSGVTPRTLRYYDEIGLLSPRRISSGGYRIYGKAEVDLLQQILLYREMGIGLEKIKCLLTSPDFDREQALAEHLEVLCQKKRQIELLIENVSKTITSLKGENRMDDREKFKGLKESLIAENERQYGTEIREKYGDEAVDEMNAKVSGMSREEWNEQERLSAQILECLKLGMEDGNPASAKAQEACDLHRQWLCHFWKKGLYSKESHMAMGEMYVADQRFTRFYGERVAPGAAEFLRDALRIYTV